MTNNMMVHFDNSVGFSKPVLILQQENDGDVKQIEASSQDDFGSCFEVAIIDDVPLIFAFREQSDDASENAIYRTINPIHYKDVHEVWCRGWNPFVYVKEPQKIEAIPASEIVDQQSFVDGTFISDSGGRFAIGSSCIKDGGVFFGLFHPHAARVYVTGDFNDWQYPDCESPNPDQFCEMQLYRGYFDAPNVWLLKVDEAQVGQAYKFYIEFNSLAGDHLLENRLMVDPYARFLDNNYERNDSLIVNPSQYEWHDADYQTTAIHELIIYELHVHGFTHDHPDIEADHQGKYVGIIDRIEAGYFDKLGISCLYLMPISEVPTPQAEDALGYNTSLFLAIERDFGAPDDLRQLVDTAHQNKLAVIIDQVFNHSANSWNPLWKFILDYPEDADKGEEGGLYFSGSSPWGNRLATERTETQNMLIDACKLMIVEYHIDGFRFDATNSNYIDHGFLHRLADELQALKPDVILIAENLPNQSDLNREGYNGFGQWCDYFHDAIKAFLRESRFEGTDNVPESLGDTFYFSKAKFAAHTNNVVNYCESHDEHSVLHEVGFEEALSSPQAKERKGRLGLFATMMALGQPMIYMGQELGIDRARNLIYFDFPENLDENGFYQWASRLICLRKRYPALKIHGFNPIEDGQFQWLLGAWLDDRSGGGKRVLGWRSIPTEHSYDQMVILLNFENHSVEVDIPFGMSGTWIRLASIKEVNDIAPIGTNSVDDDTVLHVENGVFNGFVLPDSSGFIYKYQP